MLLLGCKPPGRHTEQHDIFFGIAEKLKDLVPQINKFWPEAAGKIHIDAWREVTAVDGFRISIAERTEPNNDEDFPRLFFINLGGYQQDVFDEFHFKIITVQKNKAAALQYSKTTEFFKQIHFPGAESHVDDKYGVDVDDLHQIDDILPGGQKQQFTLKIVIAEDAIVEDEIHLGYFKLNALP
jgi:hypothetical protein